METYPIYLWPRGALASRLSSDTLFGAVCWAIRILDLADVGTLLADFNARPRFAFSAPFPVLGNNYQPAVRFYPRPLLPPLSPAQVNALTAEELRRQPSRGELAAKMCVIERAKRFKQLNYLSEALFIELITGQTDMLGLFRRFRKAGSRATDVEATGNVWLSYAERRSVQTVGVLSAFVNTTDVQHNQVDRVAGATVEGLLFFESETFFRRGSGLWCVVRTDAETLANLIQPALRYLADTGLGANRTTGKGQFRIEVGAPLALPEAAKPNSFVTLSRYTPAAGEWSRTGHPLYYELQTLWPKRESKFAAPVLGQRTPPVRKRRLRMFAPGSIFPLAERRKLYGQLVQAVPPGESSHTVWQSGLAVPVFANFANEGGKEVAG